jgi:hypothetical protein
MMKDRDFEILAIVAARGPMITQKIIEHSGHSTTRVHTSLVRLRHAGLVEGYSRADEGITGYWWIATEDGMSNAPPLPGAPDEVMV